MSVGVSNKRENLLNSIDNMDNYNFKWSKYSDENKNEIRQVAEINSWFHNSEWQLRNPLTWVHDSFESKIKDTVQLKILKNTSL